MSSTDFEIRLAEEFGTLAIYEEYFFIVQNGKERKLRLHDYGEIYRIPGLYAYLASEIRYQSPDVLSSLLMEQVTQAGNRVEDLVVLEIGAGSGLFGKAIAKIGVKSITGVDISLEAAAAAEREYPGIYENYYAEDLTNLSEMARQQLTSKGFNCLVCCSALGGSHISAKAFTTALNAITSNGLIVFNFSQDAWDKDNKGKGAGELIQLHPWITETNILEILATRPYQHRIYMDGRSIEHIAIIARKRC